MEKIWYISIAGQKEGPFTVLQLRRDERLNPDTLVWRKGFLTWMPIREVPELKVVFEDSEDQILPIPEDQYKAKPDSEIAIDLKEQFPYYVYWLILALLLVLYALYQSRS